jgi:hypothetical protein
MTQAVIASIAGRASMLEALVCSRTLWMGN